AHLSEMWKKVRKPTGLTVSDQTKRVHRRRVFPDVSPQRVTIAPTHLHFRAPVRPLLTRPQIPSGGMLLTSPMARIPHLARNASISAAICLLAAVSAGETSFSTNPTRFLVCDKGVG